MITTHFAPIRLEFAGLAVLGAITLIGCTSSTTTEPAAAPPNQQSEAVPTLTAPAATAASTPAPQSSVASAGDACTLLTLQDSAQIGIPSTYVQGDGGKYCAYVAPAKAGDKFADPRSAYSAVFSNDAPGVALHTSSKATPKSLKLVGCTVIPLAGPGSGAFAAECPTSGPVKKSHPIVQWTHGANTYLLIATNGATAIELQNLAPTVDSRILS